MKLSDMSKRQKKAYYNIKYAANDLLGGLENDLLDNSEDSDEYKSAKSLLADHDKLVKILYRYATTTLYYDRRAAWYGKFAEKFIRDINFCGKEWLLECCEACITREGY